MNSEQPAKSGVLTSWTRFWFAPIDPTGLHLIRVGAGLLFFFWLLSFAGRQEEFFGLQGWFDRKAFSEAIRQPDNVPEPISWSVLYLLGSNPALVNVVYALALGVIGLFTLGIATRLTAPLTWVMVASFVCNPAISYDADHLLIPLAFYLMIGYLLLGVWNGPGGLWALVLGSSDGGPITLWQRVRGLGPPATVSVSANLTLRLIQIHFAILVVVCGLHKLQYGDWWAGLAFWYPLHPPLLTTPEYIRAEIGNSFWWLIGLSLSQYLLLAWQIGFPLFAWRKGWRIVLLGGAAIGWGGANYLYGLPLFGPVFFLGALAYVTPEEWGWVESGLRRFLQSSDQEEAPTALDGPQV